MTDPPRFQFAGAFVLPAAVASASAAYMETRAVARPIPPDPGHHVESTVTSYGMPSASPSADRDAAARRAARNRSRNVCPHDRGLARRAATDPSRLVRKTDSRSCENLAPCWGLALVHASFRAARWEEHPSVGRFGGRACRERPRRLDPAAGGDYGQVLKPNVVGRARPKCSRSVKPA